MNLIIDQGNTQIKYALFDFNDIVLHGKTDSLSEVALVIQGYLGKVTNGIYSSVSKEEYLHVQQLFPFVVFLHLTHSTPVPLKNNYKTPHTLGLDRLAAAVGGTVLFANTELLIVDAGSALTYEYVSAKPAYLGGNISPGLQMRFKALHTFTHKLPLLEPLEDEVSCGYDTASAIRAGVENGIVCEVRGVIAEFMLRQPQGKVILTGGDSPFFDKRLKSSIFAAAELVLIGLNRILNYTIEKSNI